MEGSRKKESTGLKRRDALKLSGAAIGGLAFGGFHRRSRNGQSPGERKPRMLRGADLQLVELPQHNAAATILLLRVAGPVQPLRSEHENDHCSAGWRMRCGSGSWDRASLPCDENNDVESDATLIQYTGELPGHCTHGKAHRQTQENRASGANWNSRTLARSIESETG